jgi:phosphoglycerate-specific signal transduction histidine kinase
MLSQKAIDSIKTSRGTVRSRQQSAQSGVAQFSHCHPSRFVDDPENIFEPFISTKKKGMGIGLAVSCSIVEVHEGRLWAENNPDFGARITFKLPLAKHAQ